MSPLQLRWPRRHSKWEKSFNHFPGKFWDWIPNQFWKFELLFRYGDIHCIILLKNVPEWQHCDLCSALHSLKIFNILYFQCTLCTEKYTSKIIYICIPIPLSTYVISSSPLADKILRKLPAPHKTLSRPYLFSCTINLFTYRQILLGDVNSTS